MSKATFAIDAKSKAQKDAMENWLDGDHVVLIGPAGTGKSFLALAMAAQAISSDPKRYKRVRIIRSAVPTRSIGYLPGDMDEKLEPYRTPYFDAIRLLLKEQYRANKDLLVFDSSSFLRSVNFENEIVIIDEAQNMTFHELDTCVTRVAENCRLIVAGDYRQVDLPPREESGLKKMVEILSTMSEVAVCELTKVDIVRSDFVREYVFAKEEHESEKK